MRLMSTPIHCSIHHASWKHNTLPTSLESLHDFTLPCATLRERGGGEGPLLSPAPSLELPAPTAGSPGRAWPSSLAQRTSPASQSSLYGIARVVWGWPP